MQPSVERFTGFADEYDQVRPSPPEVIADLLLQLAQVEVAGRVVDVGCGSGLSMMMWVGKTRAIIGLEPAQDMRREAGRSCFTLFPPGGVEWSGGAAPATHIPPQ